MTCEVTFVKRVEANDEEHALEVEAEGDSTLLGITIGDSVDFGLGDHCEVLADKPHNIPAPFMVPELSQTDVERITYWLSLARDALGGTASAEEINRLITIVRTASAAR
jgi:hypothetical protein